MRWHDMDRYFFNLHECGTVTIDPEGRDFVSLAVARASAVIDARAIMCGELAGGSLCLSCHIEILSAEGQLLARVPFKDAVKLTGA